MKKFIALLLTVVLTASVAIGGTVAYLQDDARNDNTMTMGKVDISQWEYEREKDANGNYTTATFDNQNSYKLVSFTQDKMLLPCTEIKADGDNNGGAGTWDSTTVRMTQVGSYGGMSVFENPNAVDKFVVVKNEGNTDAYIRTVVAVEIGSADVSLLGFSFHSTWSATNVGTVTIDGTTYYLFYYSYNGAGSTRHANGVLPAGEMAYPSLSQVYLKSHATNEDMTKLDGNNNSKLDILVLSQAVQADGFDDAQTALNAAFGEVNATNAAEWFATQTDGE